MRLRIFPLLMLVGLAFLLSACAHLRAQQLVEEARRDVREGRAHQAMEKAREALELCVQAKGPSHPEVADVLVVLAQTLVDSADYAGARTALERALTIREQALGPANQYVAETLNSLGWALLLSGDTAGAKPAFERALVIYQKARGPRSGSLVGPLHGLGIVSRLMGDYQAARRFYDQALAIRERDELGRWRPSLASLLVGYGDLLRVLGDYAGARAAFERALAIQERAYGPEHPDLPRILSKLGDVLLDTGDLAGAQPLFARSFAIANKVSVRHVRWRAVAGLGRIQEREQNWAEAVILFRAAVTDLEDLAGQFDDEAQRTQFLQASGGRDVYDALTRALLKLHEQDPSRGYDQEAWAILDAKQKRVTAEALSAARPTLQNPEAQAEMQNAQAKRDQAGALERNLREKQANPVQEKQSEAIHNLTTQLARTKAEYLAQVQGFLQRYPQYKSQFVDQQTVDPKALAKFAERLPKDTLAVQYFATPDQLYVFVVAPGGKFQVKAQAVAQAKLFGLVKRTRELIERGVERVLPWRDDGSEIYRRDVAPLKAVMRELSEHLLKPIEAELRSSRGLILIPNDLLFYLPFSALIREAPDGGNRFLAETHAVSYVTQLELTDLLGPGTAAPDAPLLAVANPDGSLPGASREVRALAQIRRTMTTLDGPQATKASFLSQAGRFLDLHLATHGVLDPQHPERSYLLLAGKDEMSQRLGIGEIAGLSLQSGLTVLSACETALGEQVPGAALITLAAAFSQAGSQSIVASLWKVNDAATRNFMVAFYTNLHSGRAAALHNAQLDLLANPATANPFYWASFILMGAR